MRASTLCMLSAALAALSLFSRQASAATLTVHTQTPKVNVHLPPTKVNVKPAPKVAVHEIHITKTVDKSSPKLYEALHNGTHIKKAIIEARPAGGSNTTSNTADDKKQMLLDLNGIKGESQDNPHPIEIQTFKK